jgi:hypothetical protein
VLESNPKRNFYKKTLTFKKPSRAISSGRSESIKKDLLQKAREVTLIAKIMTSTTPLLCDVNSLPLI